MNISDSMMNESMTDAWEWVGGCHQLGPTRHTLDHVCAHAHMRNARIVGRTRSGQGRAGMQAGRQCGPPPQSHTQQPANSSSAQQSSLKMCGCGSWFVWHPHVCASTAQSCVAAASIIIIQSVGDWGCLCVRTTGRLGGRGWGFAEWATPVPCAGCMQPLLWLCGCPGNTCMPPTCGACFWGGVVDVVGPRCLFCRQLILFQMA